MAPQSDPRPLTRIAQALRRPEPADTGPAPEPAPEHGSHFVTLLKPEALSPTPPAFAPDVLREAGQVLEKGEVTVVRCALFPAAGFAARGHLLQQYPRLHRVAADGPGVLTSGAARELAALRERVGAAEVYGAYDALALAPEISPRELEERCRSAGIHRLGPGSYAAVLTLRGRTAVVLNGFLPALAESYTLAPGPVAVLECHSPREIHELRTGLLGALDPAAAAPDTLRGALGALAAGHGVPLSEGRNGVHLSAGHLEGMFQVWRYFTAADGAPLSATALGRSLAAAGVPLPAVAALASDPNVPATGAGSDPAAGAETVGPHGATENLRRDEVLDRVRRWTTSTERGPAA